MAAQIRDDGNTLRAVPVFRVRDGAGALLMIKEGKARDAGNVSRIFLPAVTGGVSPAALNEVQGAFNFPITVTTQGETQIVVENMLAPITFEWRPVSGATDIYPTSPATAKTRFFSSFTSEGTRNAIFNGKATDAIGRTIEGTVDVAITAADWD